MGRFLFVSHDAGGTVPPVIAIAQALVRRGHEVTVLGQPSIEARVSAVGGRFVPFDGIGDYAVGVTLEEQLDVAGTVIAGREPGDQLLATARSCDADVVIVDCNLSGACSAAETLDRPSVVLLHSLYRTFVDLWFADYWPLLEGVVNGLRSEYGLASCSSWTDLFAPHDRMYSVVPSPFDDGDVPDTMRHFGFLVPDAPAAAPDDPYPRGDAPSVLVSLSSTYQRQERLLETIVDALASLDVRGLVTTSVHVDPASITAPPNVTVRDYVPHTGVLPLTDVVVTHGGLGTIAGALDHGVPLVVTPIARDQFLNAERVAALGAGFALGAEPSAGEVRDAVERVLKEPAFAEAARDVARKSLQAGGAGAAAADLEGLLV